jgi:hypothetical protein
MPQSHVVGWGLWNQRRVCQQSEPQVGQRYFPVPIRRPLPCDSSIASPQLPVTPQRTVSLG